MGDMREVFDYYKEYCKEQHRKRVAKTPDRIAYAAKMLEQRSIKYELKNQNTGHFHCRRKSDNQLIQFWAGTGKIMGYQNARGLKALLSICEK